MTKPRRRLAASATFFEQCQRIVNEGFTAQPHYRPHVRLADRHGGTESPVFGTPLQGSAAGISAGRSRARPQSIIHTPNTAARD